MNLSNFNQLIWFDRKSANF